MTGDSFDPLGFAFQGRTAAEYERMFDLTPSRWESVLDCGAGPSSFTATTHDTTDVVAADVAYRAPASELHSRCETNVAQVASRFQAIEDRFVWDFYTNLEERVAYLERAHEQFLEDFSGSPGRYVAAAIPHLPFETDSFDLVLTAHLLFMYDGRLDERFHQEAIEELCRVARTEVRVYPLVSLRGRPSEHVEPSVARVQELGHQAERRSVPFEFQRGADEMLVIDPA